MNGADILLLALIAAALLWAVLRCVKNARRGGCGCGCDGCSGAKTCRNAKKTRSPRR